jgi:hypothetical protein
METGQKVNATEKDSSEFQKDGKFLKTLNTGDFE